MKSKILKRLLIYTMLYLGIGILLFVFQREFLYFPTEEIPHNYKQEDFQNQGESLKVIVLNRGRKKAILYFGGNGEAVIYNAQDFINIFPSYTVYLLNYRGYGGSSGFSSEAGLFSDALFLFDKVKKKYSGISLIGRSLGSGIAVFLATKRTVEKLVLVTPYDSIESIAQGSFPIYPMSLLLKDKYDSMSRVEDIKADTFAIIAENDTVISRHHSDRLIEAFPKNKIQVKVISGVGHNDLSITNDYSEALNSYFEEESKR